MDDQNHDHNTDWEKRLLQLELVDQNILQPNKKNCIREPLQYTNVGNIENYWAWKHSAAKTQNNTE